MSDLLDQTQPPMKEETRSEQQEWTWQRLEALYHPTLARSEYLKKIAIEINAALSAERERVKKLADEWWGMALTAERQTTGHFKLMWDSACKNLAAERKRHEQTAETLSRDIVTERQHRKKAEQMWERAVKAGENIQTQLPWEKLTEPEKEVDRRIFAACSKRPIQAEKLAAERKLREQAISDFTIKIWHGDAVHRQWLTEAADAYIQGFELPLPRSQPIDDNEVNEAWSELLSELDIGYITDGKSFECGECGAKAKDKTLIKHEGGCIHPAVDKVADINRKAFAKLKSGLLSALAAIEEHNKFAVTHKIVVDSSDLKKHDAELLLPYLAAIEKVIEMVKPYEEEGTWFYRNSGEKAIHELLQSVDLSLLRERVKGQREPTTNFMNQDQPTIAGERTQTYSEDTLKKVVDEAKVMASKLLALLSGEPSGK